MRKARGNDTLARGCLHCSAFSSQRASFCIIGLHHFPPMWTKFNIFGGLCALGKSRKCNDRVSNVVCY